MVAPAYQHPEGTALQATAGLQPGKVPARAAEKNEWPDTLPEQAQAVRSLFRTATNPLTGVEATSLFKGARKQKVVELLDTLVGLGQIVKLEDGRYAR